METDATINRFQTVVLVRQFRDNVVFYYKHYSTSMGVAIISEDGIADG